MQNRNGRQDIKLQENFPIEIKENNGFQVIDARELHSFLKSKQQFTNWIKNRIEEYGFVENEDFEVFHKFMKNPKGGRPGKEYAVTLDMAKELSMVERNEKGRQARKYFIEIEKAFKQELLQKLKNKQAKQLTETASYKEGQMFPQKMGNTMVLGVYKHGELWYQMNRLMRYLAFSDSAISSYKNKISKNTLFKHNSKPGSKTRQYFINKQGVDEMLVLSSHELNSEFVENVYRDLFRVTIDGKETSNTKYPYKFTFEQMNKLFYEVSKIQRVKLQKDIYILLRGGRVL